jgi:hypothetical protein
MGTVSYTLEGTHMADQSPYSDIRDRSGVPRWVYVIGIIALVVVLLVGFMTLTGSGGGHKPPGGSSGQSQGGTFSDQQQEQFAQCMREQGIDFRSRVGESGQVEMNPGPGVDVDGAAFREAQAVCQAKFTPGGGQPSGGRP